MYANKVGIWKFYLDGVEVGVDAEEAGADEDDEPVDEASLDLTGSLDSTGCGSVGCAVGWLFP